MVEQDIALVARAASNGPSNLSSSPQLGCIIPHNSSHPSLQPLLVATDDDTTPVLLFTNTACHLAWSHPGLVSYPDPDSHSCGWNITATWKEVFHVAVM
ncbi:hypothetical protein EMCRGX_G000017 [Ephydatia muelleri]